MKHQEIARKNIVNACNWIVGEYYNSMQDGYIEDLPTMEELQEEIYLSALRDRYTGGSVQFDNAPKEMRFAGTEFCKSVIREFCEADPDVQEIVNAE